jgi:hypothetical protein
LLRIVWRPTAIGGAQYGAFFILRKKVKTVYEARSALRPYAGPKQEPLGSGFFAPVTAALRIPDEEIIRHNGLDAYLFVRFNKLMVLFFLPVAFFSLVILAPIYGTSDGGNSGINKVCSAPATYW